MVELRAEDDRFLRLLEILGLWYEKGKLLIFVGSQEKCDDLFRNLLRVRFSRPTAARLKSLTAGWPLHAVTPRL